MAPLKAKNILLFIFCFFMLCTANKLSAEKLDHSLVSSQVHVETTGIKSSEHISFEQDLSFYKPSSSQKYFNRYRSKYHHVRTSNVQPAKPFQGLKYEYSYDPEHHDFSNEVDAGITPYYYAFLFRLTPF